jgi:hypothetical protein
VFARNSPLLRVSTADATAGMSANQRELAGSPLTSWRIWRAALTSCQNKPSGARARLPSTVGLLTLPLIAGFEVSSSPASSCYCQECGIGPFQARVLQIENGETRPGRRPGNAFPATSFALRLAACRQLAVVIAVQLVCVVHHGLTGGRSRLDLVRQLACEPA